MEDGDLLELTRIGCTLQSTVFEFFEALKARLSRNGKYDAQLDTAAEHMVDEFGVMTVSQLRMQEYQRWEKVFTTAQLPTAWISTFALVLGTQIDQAAAGRPAGTPSSASLLAVDASAVSTANEPRSAKANLGQRLKALGQLDSVRLPEAIFDAIHECPDYSRYAITYNDMKSVLTEIWKWVFCEFGVATIDKEFARHIEKELVKRILSLPPGRKAWCPIILTRFENGARKAASVRRNAAELRLARTRQPLPLPSPSRVPAAHDPLPCALGSPRTVAAARSRPPTRRASPHRTLRPPPFAPIGYTQNCVHSLNPVPARCARIARPDVPARWA